MGEARRVRGGWDKAGRTRGSVSDSSIFRKKLIEKERDHGVNLSGFIGEKAGYDLYSD